MKTRSAVVEASGIAFGGITGGDSSNGTDNPVVVYNPITDSWSAAAAEPTPRDLGAAAAEGRKLFVAGGYATASLLRPRNS
jgi:hypothetical protein